jgi:hypothetical protein
MKPDWGLFTYLHGAGRTEAHKWLDRNRRHVGKRESIDLRARFLEGGPEATASPPASVEPAMPAEPVEPVEPAEAVGVGKA